MNKPRYYIQFLLSFLLLFSWNINAQNLGDSLIHNLRHHVGFLAHDSLLGRQTGSPSERKAADYLVQEFQKTKLEFLSV